MNADQLPILFPAPSTRRTDPATSHQAAADTAPLADTNRQLALRLLRANPGGLTDYELAALSGLQQNSVGKRRGELRDAGLVEDSGRRRPGPSGSRCIVWVAVEGVCSPMQMVPSRQTPEA